ncbi:MAG TPA: biopolymer transporter ExbD [Kofleriaceae bacterium]|jgi:biopolymer transport protein ExbD|nr:biopolymer transporter ExbD [Kofleriaceae bacterium]
MALALGSGDKKAVNVELNIIPFIDVMSCLVAFLMLTVVWIDLARLDIRPAGHGDGIPCDGPACDDVRLSVLVDADQIWIGVSRVNDSRTIPNTPSGYDWRALEAALREHKASPWFEGTTAIEIAVNSTRAHPIPYRTMIAAMDVAVKTGFVDVGLTDPQGLSSRPL